jgi:hypothetical protein
MLRLFFRISPPILFANRQRSKRIAIFLTAILVALCPIASAQEPDSKKEPKLEGRGAMLAALRDSAFKPELLEARQRRVMDELPPGAILIAAAASPPLRDYEGYEQNPDFLYLTGLDQGPAVLLITGRREAMQSRLFVPRPNPMRELWEGPLKKGPRPSRGWLQRSLGAT